MGLEDFFLEGKPGLEQNFAFDQMMGARERFQGVLNAKRAETGQEPLAFEPPSRISTGGVIFGNIGSFFGGEPPRQEPFARTFSLDQIDQAFEDAGFHPDEFQGLREAMSVEDILALQFRRPLSYLGSGQRQGAESGSDATRARIGREVRGLPEEPLQDEINQLKPGDKLVSTDPITGRTQLLFKAVFAPIKAGPGDALFIPQEDGSMLLTDAIYTPAEVLTTGNVIVTDAAGKETVTAMTDKEFIRRFREDPLGSIRWAPKKEEVTTFAGVEPTVKKTIELQLLSLIAEQANLSMLDSMLNPDWLSTWGRLQHTFLEWGGNLTCSIQMRSWSTAGG